MLDWKLPLSFVGLKSQTVSRSTRATGRDVHVIFSWLIVTRGFYRSKAEISTISLRIETKLR